MFKGGGACHPARFLTGCQDLHAQIHTLEQSPPASCLISLRSLLTCHQDAQRARNAQEWQIHETRNLRVFRYNCSRAAPASVWDCSVGCAPSRHISLKLPCRFGEISKTQEERGLAGSAPLKRLAAAATLLYMARAVFPKSRSLLPSKATDLFCVVADSTIGDTVASDDQPIFCGELSLGNGDAPLRTGHCINCLPFRKRRRRKVSCAELLARGACGRKSVSAAA